MEKKAKTGYVVAGATIALASSALILDFVIRKRAKKAVMAAGILVGVAGVAAGLAVASYPKLSSMKKLNTNKLFNVKDLDLIDQGLLAELGEEEDEYAELSVQQPTSAPVVIELAKIPPQEETTVELPVAEAEAVEPAEVAADEAVTEVPVAAEADSDTESIDDLSLEIEFDM